MMLKSLPLLLVFIASAVNAASTGDAREDVMEKIADVVALARACPALEMDTALVTTVALSQEIGKSNTDYDTIDAMANAREGAIRRGNAAAACKDGTLQYGPNGRAFPGLLRERS